MKHSEEYIENRLKWRFKKNGLPQSNSHFFDDLSQEERQEFEALVDFLEFGKPVLLFNGKKSHWTLFGTKLIASGTHQSFDRILYSEIDEHTVGDDPFGIFSGKEPKRKNFKKIEQHLILIRKKDGNKITLHGPIGEEIYGMYNIILMLQRMSRSSE